LAGTVLLICGLILNNHIALLTLGSLLFIPGAYHLFLAYKIFQGNEGYSVSDLPEF